MKTTPIELDAIQGHIILYCKGWYYPKKSIDFIDGLRRIWEIHCGLPKCGQEIDKYIANAMFRILKTCKPDQTHLVQLLHDSVEWNVSCPIKSSPIQRIIWFYKGELGNLQIKEGKKILIQLPKPKKQLFKRIVAGNGKSNDYYKL